MITKKIIPVGMVSYSDADKSKKEMKVSRVVIEYRFLGILFYRKTLYMPLNFGADFYSDYMINF